MVPSLFNRKKSVSKKVCFRAFANDGDLSEWYTFDAMETGFDYKYSSKAAKSTIQGRAEFYCDRCFHGRPYCHHYSGSGDAPLTMPSLRPVVSCRMSRVESWAVLPADSNLYCVGCYEAPSADRGKETKSIWDDVGKPKNKVFFCNSDQATTSRDDQQHASWTAGSDMLSCRKEPHVLVLDGHLFVIGGVCDDHNDVPDADGDGDDDDEDEGDDEEDEEKKDDHNGCYPEVFQKLGEKHDEDDPGTSSSRAMDSNVCQQEEILETPKSQETRDLQHDLYAVIGKYGSSVLMKNWMEPKISKWLILVGLYSISSYVRARTENSQHKRKRPLDPLPLGLKKIQPPWAEVYNGKWKPLPDPPMLPHEGYGSGFICAAIEIDRVIVVGSAKENILYRYSLDTCSWTRLEGHQLNPSCSGKAVVIDRTLYWFTKLGFLMAYDLENRMWYQGTVDDQWDQSILGTYVFHPGLVHLESNPNLFGLVWADSEISGTTGQSLSQRSHLHCLKFQVVPRKTDDLGKGLLDVSIRSCHSRPIDHGITFVDCIAL